ncbi:DNA repair protein sae2/ctip [Niveomyces insectorum RCEF 264]|uniref:DNA repair protein sae2/ctip n=1 Tax=Niveomyces insectorum RCEF 264 TaxID=1081102 RepID=A0A167S019_9HYPO|nr:DNA repair protein sae2/ctip [Niveomyces insectorum RCEF 264]
MSSYHAARDGRQRMLRAVERVFERMQFDLEIEAEDRYTHRLHLGNLELEKHLELRSRIRALQEQVDALTAAQERATATTRPRLKMEREDDAASDDGGEPRVAIKFEQVDQAVQTEPEALEPTPDTPADAEAVSAAAANVLLQQSRQSLVSLRTRHNAVKTQLDQTIALARKRKKEVLDWVTYADSLEKKVAQLEKKVASNKRSSLASSGTPAATPAAPPAPPARRPTAGDGATATATPAAGGAASAAALPDGPSTPVTAEKRSPTPAVPKPHLSASFSSTAAAASSSSPSSFSGGHRKTDAHDDDDDDDDDVALPAMPAAAADANEGDAAHGPANEAAAFESTQGEPSSDASQPDLPPTPRATTNPAHDACRPVVVKREPLSDEPEVVWARPAKKQRRNDRGNSDGSSSRPQTPRAPAPAPQAAGPAVKRECSDNAVWSVPRRYRESQESIDLDEGQLALPTPRKRHVAMWDEHKGWPDESAPPYKGKAETRHEDSPLPPLPLALSSSSPFPVTTALAPLSTNVCQAQAGALPTTTTRTGASRSMKQLKRGVRELADDNEGGSHSTPRDRQHQPGTTHALPAMHPPPPSTTAKVSRLSSLLNGRPPEPSPLASLPRIAPAVKTDFVDGVDSPVSGLFGQPPPARVLLPHLRNTVSPAVKRGTAGVAAATAATGTPSTPRMGHEAGGNRSTTLATTSAAAVTAPPVPLRSRPVEQLTLDSFKINPARNDGATFAFDEVVRGRTDRTSLLDGCTDPQCCGKTFRSMAASELRAAGPAHVFRPEGVALVERYLAGGDDDTRVDARPTASSSPSSREERTELWLAARTKELADRYGKHRHRFHRRASPPGFWDADFPTSQQETRHREEAGRAEKATILERYRQAMRPNGRWLFRDE